MSTLAALRVLSIIGLLAVGGCATHALPPTERMTSHDRCLSDLDQNGYILSGWWVHIDDGDNDQWPAWMLGIANMEVKNRMLTLFDPLPIPPIEVRIVPDVGGDYEILILSHERLNDDQKEKIRKAADEAVSTAHHKWREWLDKNGKEPKEPKVSRTSRRCECRSTARRLLPPPLKLRRPRAHPSRHRPASQVGSVRQE